jgi:hypothetical protein
LLAPAAPELVVAHIAASWTPWTRLYKTALDE